MSPASSAGAQAHGKKSGHASCAISAIWQALGYGYFVITERQTGAIIGEVGLADFQRDCTPPITDPEAGWVLLPQYHGRGLAREALTALLAWSDQTMPRTVCMIDLENAPSLRLAAALGYAEYVHTTYKGAAAVLLERVAPNTPA